VHEREQQTASEQKSVDLTIAPSTRTGWEAQAGVEDLLGSPQLRLEVRRHLFGPFWIGAAGVPMRGQVGLSASVEW
jgi:hypothetical protein